MFTDLLPSSLFEVDNILTNKSRSIKIKELAETSEPDLSASTARSWFADYMTGCLAGLVLPLAFATTKNFSERIYQTFVPRCLQSRAKRLKYRQSNEVTWRAMDDDNGILSRQKRLDMEQRLRIEVTCEFEVRIEEPTTRASVAAAQNVGNGGSATYPYSVEDHHWDDTEQFLPRKPSVTVLRGPQGPELTVLGQDRPFRV